MSNYPPPPPYGSGRYSPGRPAYSDRPPFPPGNNRDYPPYPYPSSAPAPPPSAGYRYDPYAGDNRPPAPYPQPRDPYASDSYDPYTPSTAYQPPSASMRYPNHASPPIRQEHPRPIARPASPPRRVAQSGKSEGNDLSMLTPVVTANVSGFTTAIYSLPPSHLPLVKYIAVNPGDCVDIHRSLCRQSKVVWYADGCSRAGDAWCAAIEWVIDQGQSRRKMRAQIVGGDGLDSELGAICKAAEGFYESLQMSIKEGTPMSHEIIIFCDSAAAIVAIDTGSRPESLRFDALCRQICSEFTQAHFTFVWLPKNSGIEGHVLADKIAVVAASNSFTKKKKEGTLPQFGRASGSGSDQLPSGSAEAGAWQRGDADPSRRKEAFERPKPQRIELPPSDERPEGEGMAQTGFGDAEAHVPPAENSIFVTSFPESLSAKDLGVLFAQFGDLTSVDIYHTDPAHPRFAYVQYTTFECGEDAIDALNNKPIDFNNNYALDNAADLADWEGWQGSMRVVRNDGRRFIPEAIEEMFPGVAGWMLGKPIEPKSDEAEDEDMEEEKGSKRARSIAEGGEENGPNSPHKRPRQASPAAATSTGVSALAAMKPVDFAAQLSDLVTMVDMPTKATTKVETNEDDNSSVFPSPESKGASPNGNGHAEPSEQVMPPTPQTAAQIHALPPKPTSLAPTPSQEPLPTPVTAATPSSSRPALTNSAAEPQEYPIKLSVQTLHTQLNLVSNTFTKHDINNWIAHSCLIAVELDQARRALQADLFATDEGFLSGRELEQKLFSRGYTAPRVDAFITKVLKVLDGIALAEALETGEGEAGAEVKKVDDGERTALEVELEKELEKYPDQTKEAMKTSGVVMEYLHRGKELQEKKRLDIERRVKVLEGMAKIGEVVGGVVRFLLTEVTG